MDSDSETRKEAVKKILVSIPDYIQKIQCDTTQMTAPFKCAVSSCRNFFVSFAERDKYSYKFHNFPLNKALREKWRERCGITTAENTFSLKVCSDHFSPDDYIRNYKQEFQNPDFKRKLKPNAVPQNLCVVSNSNSSIPDASNDGSTNNSIEDVSSDGLFLKEINEAIDENHTLRNKFKALLDTKADIIKKIALSKKRKAYRNARLNKLQITLGDWSSNTKNKKNVIRKVFSEAQINLLLGKKKVFWSDDDLAKAFILRHMGGKECYLYLKNSLNMPLPALACVQKWAASCSNS